MSSAFPANIGVTAPAPAPGLARPPSQFDVEVVSASALNPLFPTAGTVQATR